MKTIFFYFEPRSYQYRLFETQFFQVVTVPTCNFFCQPKDESMNFLPTTIEKLKGVLPYYIIGSRQLLFFNCPVGFIIFFSKTENRSKHRLGRDGQHTLSLFYFGHSYDSFFFNDNAKRKFIRRHNIIITVFIIEHQFLSKHFEKKKKKTRKIFPRDSPN